jgi:hypothetical protein
LRIGLEEKSAALDARTVHAVYNEHVPPLSAEGKARPRRLSPSAPRLGLIFAGG